MITALPALTAQGYALDTSEAAFGFVTSSAALVGQPEALRARLEDDGYLHLPDFFERDLVLCARESLTSRLAAAGMLHPDMPATEAVLAPGRTSRLQPDIARNNPELERVVFGPELISFYQSLLGGEVRHFDYVWMRAMGPGPGAPPHCDLVYMGRGTHQLLTCWIPYGDVPLDLGGLMVLEQSHRKSDLLKSYLSRDVDTYCENRPDEAALAEQGKWSWSGHLSQDPVALRRKLGGRWLTADWRAGDLITFKMNLVHTSLDNPTRDRIRLSTDTRYQLAELPVDERWIGPNPIGHSRAGKRGRIC